ncbi:MULTISPECIES: hypothetical protein [unclassified Haloferax]|jgi:hypothetical protein|uniref:hypothetical protein n=1 Tax=unclassified Haloferax TaxID=2625095 RepID=UPI00287611EF|nr:MULTISPECIES: hypothetical protein [unclassified Haloferax]MDS0243053.1 hypothetical protein [Haloferax sp. S2CR25]MDS0446174.1 hypothetical protein [Haloferax sp. S2CR25-2]
MIQTTLTPTPLFVGADWIINLLNTILQGLTGAIGELFTAGLAEFLFFPSPYHMSAANEAFYYSRELGLKLFPIVIAFGILSMPFSQMEKARPYRQVWRGVTVIFAMALAPPMLDICLQLVNWTGQQLFPTSYSLSFAGQGMLDQLAGIGLAGVGLVVAGYLMMGVSILGVLVLLFFLFLREFLFQLTYQHFAILMVMWYIDWGPFKVSNHIAKLVFRTTGYLLLAGILMSAALATGAALAGGDPGTVQASMQGGQFAGEQATISFWRQFAGWFMGIALAGVVGAKAATMGGVPMSQVARARGAGSGSGNTASASNGDGKITRLRDQGREALSDLGSRAGGRLDEAGGPLAGISVGGAQGYIAQGKSSLNETASSISDRVGPRGTAVAAGVGSVGKFAATEGMAGTAYAAKNMNQSPMQWATAARDRYRERPLVDTGKYSDGQYKLDSFGSSGSGASGGATDSTPVDGSRAAAAGATDRESEQAGLSDEFDEAFDEAFENSDLFESGNNQSKRGLVDDNAGGSGTSPSGYSDRADGETDTGWELKPRYTLRRTGSEGDGETSAPESPPAGSNPSDNSEDNGEDDRDWGNPADFM